MKVSIVTTLEEGLVVGMRSMPGNPYNGLPLAETLEHVGNPTGTDKPSATTFVDAGDRALHVQRVRILMSWQKWGITQTRKSRIKRGSNIEPAAGHIDMDGRLARYLLRGALGDALHAIMYGAGRKLRLILVALRLLCARFGRRHRSAGRRAP